MSFFECIIIRSFSKESIALKCYYLSVEVLRMAESGGKELLNMTETDDEYAISINI